MNNQDVKQKKIIALKKAKSLLETMITMIEEDKYCIDVMQQNLAVIGLLRSFHQQMMSDHFHCCFMAAMKSGNEKVMEEKIDEVLKVTNLYNK